LFDGNIKLPTGMLRVIIEFVILGGGSQRLETVVVVKELEPKDSSR
jgi:hypothetical protein